MLPVTPARFRNRLARLAKNGTAKSVVFALCLRSLAQFGITLKFMPFWIATPAKPARNDVGWLAHVGFTMAEILLSLTIIGVVAAITLPSLTGNINERTWNTQRKALYARFSQAIALMPALNGYGTLREETDSAGSTSIEDTAAETFVTAGLAKVLKINNICDNEHLEDCGIVSSFITLRASNLAFPKTLVELNEKFNYSATSSDIHRYSVIDTKAVAFETANGESVVTYYNPVCVADMGEKIQYYAQSKMCVNFIYDLNGQKGPNTVGKDIGVISVLYPSDAVVVAPQPYIQLAGVATQPNAIKLCTENDSEYRLPNRAEAASLFYNKNLFDIGLSDSDGIWTSTSEVYNGNLLAWQQIIKTGSHDLRARNVSRPVWCVRR